MAADNDPAYYTRRAEEARALAAKAIDPAARLIHAEMANRYTKLAIRIRPKLHLVTALGRE